MTHLLLGAAALALAYLFVHWLRTAKPSGPFYVRIEDETPGQAPALYERQVRRVHWRKSDAGHSSVIRFDVEEFRRITCVPGRSYTAAQSDWFQRTAISAYSEEQTADGYADHYRRLDDETAHQLLKTQWPATLAVRKSLKKASDSERCRGVRAPLTVAGNVAR